MNKVIFNQKKKRRICALLVDSRFFIHLLIFSMQILAECIVKSNFLNQEITLCNKQKWKKNYI